jgi:hypothetical protein
MEACRPNKYILRHMTTPLTSSFQQRPPNLLQRSHKDTGENLEERLDFEAFEALMS